MSKVDLKNYICGIPFGNLEIRDSKRFLCCDGWLKNYLPDNSTPYDAWNSKEATEIRNSMLDGSFKYCDSTICPYLHQLKTIGDIGQIQPIYHKSNIPFGLKQLIEKHKIGKLNSPKTIQFSFDKSCNLKCPSCRVELIMADSKKIKLVKQNIQDIQDTFGNDVTMLYITGTGDPFVSVGFRDFLRNFDKTKWPNLQKIHLHTNATRWNKKMWDSMSNIHPYVKTCEISIDAATKDTYENKVRLGGNFDELIDNLKFISTIPTLKSIKTSFVVQESNYNEMEEFYDLMYSIFGNKVNVFFGKITNWGTFTNDEYLKHKVWDESHPLYNDFVNKLNSFILKDKVWHNLQEFLNPEKSLI